MKLKHAFAIVIVAVASFTARAGLPSTNEVAKYERYSYGEEAWFEVSKADGDTILYCLRDIDNFDRPFHHDIDELYTPYRRSIVDFYGPPPNATCVTPIPITQKFRVIGVDGGTNNVLFSSNFVGFEGYDRRIIPEEERAALSEVFNAWQKADETRIRSQPLPCQFRIGSIAGSGTLSGVAKLFYGDASKWPVIWEANKHIIKNPDIVNREVITIPKLKD